ncbi:MAG: hypothetical protein JWM34_1190 [Ilumatobacteraceae bacterium]|nr:hypothetical protein [Ilumatobacteraceae bacterium]
MTSKGLLRAGASIALIVIIPWVVISTGDEGTRGSVWILCTGIAMYSGWRLAGLLTAALPRLYEFMFWLFCYIFMGLAPASQLRTDLMPGTTPNVLPNLDLKTGIVVVLGIVGFEFGALSERSKRSEAALARRDFDDDDALDTPAGPPTTERTPMFTRVLPMLVVSVLASAYLVKSIGLGPFFGSRDERDRLFSVAIPDPTVATVIGMFTWIPALVVVHRIINGSRRSDGTRARLSWSEKGALAVSAVIILIINNPLSSARYVFGAMALSLAVLFGGFRSQKRTRWTMVGLLLALFVGFPVANSFRREQSEDVHYSLTNEYQGSDDYDSFAQIHNAIQIADTEGYTYLQQPLGVALFWVPRGVWAGKPIDTGVYIGQHRGYKFTNLSAPLWAEFYLIGGILPVLLGFVLVGKVLRRADNALVRRFLDQRQLTVVGAFMPFYLMILLRGSLLQAMALVAGFLLSVQFTKPRVVENFRIKTDERARPRTQKASA